MHASRDNSWGAAAADSADSDSHFSVNVWLLRAKVHGPVTSDSSAIRSYYYRCSIA
jgi:hypothetical protein